MGEDGFLDLDGFWVGGDVFDLGFPVYELIGFCNSMLKFVMGCDRWWYWAVSCD